jgi:hypothetical protein
MNQVEEIHRRKREVRTALLAAMSKGKITLDRIVEVTGREPETIGDWLAGIRYPPSTLLDPLEKELRKIGF